MFSFNENSDYYRKLIVEHYTKPQRRGLLNLKTGLTYHQASLSCVDNFTVQIDIKDQIIINARFIGIGCAIATAATDLFCLLIEGKTIAVVKKIISNYQAMLAQRTFDSDIIANMVAFYNVPRQSNRIKCALLGIEGFNTIL